MEAHQIDAAYIGGFQSLPHTAGKDDRDQAGLRAVAAAVWVEAIAEARTVILRRAGTYEADIDLLAVENPYKAAGA